MEDFLSIPFTEGPNIELFELPIGTSSPSLASNVGLFILYLLSNWVKAGSSAEVLEGKNSSSQLFITSEDVSSLGTSDTSSLKLFPVLSEHFFDGLELISKLFTVSTDSPEVFSGSPLRKLEIESRRRKNGLDVLHSQLGCLELVLSNKRSSEVPQWESMSH